MKILSRKLRTCLGVRGCNLRSVKRFCSQHGIKKQVSVSDNTLDLVVRSAISEVEPTYLLLISNCIRESI